MTDLHARMRIYDQAQVPDYWSEVQLRASTTSDAARPDRGPRRALLLAAALLTMLAILAAVAVGSGLVKLPPIVPVPSPSPSPSASPSAQATPSVVVHGWPSTSKNSAGVYSWSGSSCASCTYGFMHNGFGSGDVEIRIFLVPGGAVSGGGRVAMTVAGHDGSYRRIDDQHEEWEVYMEGRTILIQLSAEPGTSQVDLAEAHAIIDSMRTEPRDSQLGFRLLFTLTTNDWDSG